MAPNKKEADPLDRIAAMVDERVKAALDGKQREQDEASDPWKKLEGLINRSVDASVAKHFEAFTEGLNGKDEGEDEGDRKKGGLGILGL